MRLIRRWISRKSHAFGFARLSSSRRPRLRSCTTTCCRCTKARSTMWHRSTTARRRTAARMSSCTRSGCHATLAAITRQHAFMPDCRSEWSSERLLGFLQLRVAGASPFKGGDAQLPVGPAVAEVCPASGKWAGMAKIGWPTAQTQKPLSHQRTICSVRRLLRGAGGLGGYRSPPESPARHASVPLPRAYAAAAGHSRCRHRRLLLAALCSVRAAG